MFWCSQLFLCYLYSIPGFFCRFAYRSFTYFPKNFDNPLLSRCNSAVVIVWACGTWHKRAHLPASGTPYYHACTLSLSYVAARAVTANTGLPAVRDSSYHNVCDLYRIMWTIIYNLSVCISSSSSFSQQSWDFSSFALPISMLSDMKLWLDFSVLPCFVQLINELQTVSSFMFNNLPFRRLYCIFMFRCNESLEVCAYHSSPVCLH